MLMKSLFIDLAFLIADFADFEVLGKSEHRLSKSDEHETPNKSLHSLNEQVSEGNRI